MHAPLQPLAHSPPAALEQAGTFEERNVTEFAKEKLKELLVGPAEQGSALVKGGHGSFMQCAGA